jgi:hypothetical protein
MGNKLNTRLSLLPSLTLLSYLSLSHHLQIDLLLILSLLILPPPIRPIRRTARVRFLPPDLIEQNSKRFSTPFSLSSRSPLCACRYDPQ